MYSGVQKVFGQNRSRSFIKILPAILSSDPSYVHTMDKHLTEREKGAIVGFHLAGVAIRRISEIMRTAKSTVFSVISVHRKRGTVETKPRSGRPKALSPRDKRAIKHTVMQDRRIHLENIKGTMATKVSSQTLRNALSEMGFSSRIAVKKPFLSSKHMADRLNFARKYSHWSANNWSKVIWTDVSSFELGNNSRQIRVWRASDEKYIRDCLAPTFKSGRTSIMVWGAITSTTKSPMVLLPAGERTAADFVRNVYEEVLGDFWQHHPNPDEYVLMEDGAPVHKTNLPKNWLDQIGLTKLEWPANSPDLNPIENLWFICKSRVQVHERSTNQIEHFKLIERVWNEIPQEKISSMIDTMPNRIRAVIETKGLHTRW